MRLEDAIRQAIARVRTHGPTAIARPSDGKRHQVRFARDADPQYKTREPRGIRVEARHWIDQTPTIPKPSPTSARGTVGAFVGWSRWSTFIGFGVAGVLADDWAIVEED